MSSLSDETTGQATMNGGGIIVGVVLGAVLTLLVAGAATWLIQ